MAPSADDRSSASPPWPTPASDSVEFGCGVGKQPGRRSTRRLRLRLPVFGRQVVEDSRDDIGIFDAGDNPYRAATLFTDLDINAEYPLEAAGPRHRAVLFSGGHRPIFNAPLATPGWSDPRAPA